MHCFFYQKSQLIFNHFKILEKKKSKKLTTGSVFIIREIQQKQNWLSEVIEESKDPVLPFIGKFTILDNPKTVAKDIIDTLEVSSDFSKESSPIKYWIDKIEAKGTFVSRTSYIHSRLLLDKDELQGFVISDPYAPFVFINSKDWIVPQLFTLVHELAHLWIAITGISNNTELISSKIDPVEIFCNEVAANVLMPKNMIMTFDKTIFESSKTIYKQAKLMGVSSIALLVRAMKLSLITTTRYNELKKEVQIDFEKFIKKEEEKKQKVKKSKGGPNTYLLRVNKNGKLFTQFVLDAYRGGRIEPTQASSLLNTKVNDFSKLEMQI